VLTDPGCSELIGEVGTFSQDATEHMATGNAVEVILVKDLGGICLFQEVLYCFDSRGRAESNRGFAGGKQYLRTC
jgi:hypothetical protein